MTADEARTRTLTAIAPPGPDLAALYVSVAAAADAGTFFILGYLDETAVDALGVDGFDLVPLGDDLWRIEWQSS